MEDDVVGLEFFIPVSHWFVTREEVASVGCVAVRIPVDIVSIEDFSEGENTVAAASLAGEELEDDIPVRVFRSYDTMQTIRRGSKRLWVINSGLDV